MSETTAATPEPQASAREELRLAVVLNGGVSLAVWIGGVSLEIDRLTRAEGAYGKLLRLVDSSARVDVITGTSAGGINGAALGLAQVNASADLRGLRSMWATEARMEALLRTPFVGAPSSLLKGDEYFLPTLERALSSLTVDYRKQPALLRPVNIAITTTLLQGARKVGGDSLGQSVPQEIHAGVLSFKHESDENVDPFHPDNIDTTVRKLAIAARSSAGFPLAFEPSFIRAKGPGSDGELDLTTEADWAQASAEGVDHSRYGVDGGVLVNTPTLAALDAIERLGAHTAVRRVMLLVFPHAPGDSTPMPVQKRSDAPSLVETVGGILGAMRSEADRTHVEKIEEHNRRAIARRAGRSDVLVSLLLETRRTARDRDEDLEASAVSQLLESRYVALFQHYRDLRVRRAARDFADRLPPSPKWPYDRVVRAVEEAQDSVERARRREDRYRAWLPYVTNDASWTFSPSDGSWPWGVSTAEHMANDVLELIKHIEWRDLAPQARLVVDETRAAIQDARSALITNRGAFNDACEAAGVTRVAPDPNLWRLWLDAYAHAYTDRRGMAGGLESLPGLSTVRERLLLGLDAESGQKVVAQVDAIGRATQKLRAVLPAPYVGAAPDIEEDLDGAEDGVVQAWSSLLHDAVTPAQIVQRLLQVDVVTACLGSGPEHGSEQVIELAQISLQTENRFATVTKLGADKLGGNRLGRFAGFLKESWRVNDWTWGRLDAATMLCRTVLEPGRVRRTLLATYPTPDRPWPDADDPVAQRNAAEEWVSELIEELFHGQTPTRGFADLREGAVQDMARYVFGHESPAPTLEHVADLFAWSIQGQIAVAELPALAHAVKADDRDGAHRASRGRRFVEEHRSMLKQLGALPALDREETPSAAHVAAGNRALEVFDHAGVGREPLGQESTGDLMIRTAVTAGAMGVTLLDSSRLGVPALKPITRTVRGIALLPYWLARGLSGASPLGRSAAASALAIGAAMLGVSLLASSSPRWVALLGLAAVFAAVGYSALRTGSLVHGLVLVAPVIPLTVYGIAIQDDGAPSGGRTVVFLVALVVGVIALGSLPGLTRTPGQSAHELARAIKKHKVRAVAIATLAVAAMVVTVIVALDLIGPDQVHHAASRMGVIGQTVIRPGGRVLAAIELALTAAVMGVFLVLALRGARQLQVHQLHRTTVDDTASGSPAGGAGEPGSLEDSREWVPVALTDSSGVATSWAWVYSLVLLVAGLLLAESAMRADFSGVDGQASDDQTLSRALEWTLWSAVATCGLLSLSLLAAVVVLPRRAKTQIERRMIIEATFGSLPIADDPAEARTQVLNRLITRGATYTFLTEPDPSSATGARLRLTERGKELAERLRHEVHHPGAQS